MASFFFLNFSLGRFKTDSIIKSLRKRSQILSNVKLGYNNKALLLPDAVTNAKTTLMMGRTLDPPRENISRVPRYEVCGLTSRGSLRPRRGPSITLCLFQTRVPPPTL